MDTTTVRNSIAVESGDMLHLHDVENISSNGQDNDNQQLNSDKEDIDALENLLAQGNESLEKQSVFGQNEKLENNFDFNTEVSPDESIIEQIDKINAFIAESAELLSLQIDNSFSSIVNEICTISNNLSKLGLMQNRTSAKIQRIAVAVKNWGSLIGTVEAVYTHNKMLDELLEKKKKIALEKIEFTKSCYKRTLNLLQTYRTTLLQATSSTYSLSYLRQGENLILNVNYLKSVESIYRTTQLSLLLLEYLISEYNAWIAGTQCGEMKHPTMLDATKLTLWVMNTGNLPSHKDAIYRLLTTPFQSNEIIGRDLLLLSEEHLASCALLHLGGDGNDVDITTPNQLSVELLKNLNTNVLPPMLKYLAVNNNAFYGVFECSNDIDDYVENGAWILTPTMITIGITYFAARFLSYAIDIKWLYWTIVVIMSLIALSILRETAFTINDKRGYSEFLMRNHLRRHLLSCAGYRYIKAQDTEKKSYREELKKNIIS